MENKFTTEELRKQHDLYVKAQKIKEFYENRLETAKMFINKPNEYDKQLGVKILEEIITNAPEEFKERAKHLKTKYYAKKKELDKKNKRKPKIR